MKSLVGLVALFCGTAAAAATVSWDPLPADLGVRLYIDGQQVVETQPGEPSAQITLPKTGGTLTARSYKGATMSAESDPLEIPGAPANLSITVTITVE